MRRPAAGLVALALAGCAQDAPRLVAPASVPSVVVTPAPARRACAEIPGHIRAAGARAVVLPRVAGERADLTGDAVIGEIAARRALAELIALYDRCARQ